jgi:resolvase domain protein
LIQNTPGWEYAGVYADEGISGTKMDSRPEFIRMLADCEAGKIEILSGKWIQTHDCEHGPKPHEIRHFASIA